MTQSSDLATPLHPAPTRPPAGPAASRGTHCFTVDVEEHFQVSAFDRVVTRESWDRMPSRVVRNTEILLDLLAEFGVVGTFFTLGWIADHHPGLIRTIVKRGHEVASHGWWHRR